MEEVIIESESEKEMELKNQISLLKEENSNLKEQILYLTNRRKALLRISKNKSEEILLLKDDKRKLREQISLLKNQEEVNSIKLNNKIKKLEGNNSKSFTWTNFDIEFPELGPLIKEVAKHLKLDLCEYRKSEANSWARIYKKLDQMIKNETTTEIKFKNYLKILSKSKLVDWSFKEGEFRPVIKNIVDLVEKYVFIRNYIEKNRGKIL